DRGRAADRRAAFAELDVGGRVFEPVRGDGADAVAQDRRGLLHRARGHRRATAAARARAEARDRGIALDRVDVFDARAECVGRELYHGRLEAVPGRAARDVDVDRARRLDADRGGFGAV